MKIAFAAILALSASTFPALASSGGCEFPETTASVVYLGDPCDLVEPEVVEAEEVASTDPNAALINADGLPTSMPVVMRPSVDAAPAAAAPAAAAPADTAKPDNSAAQPAPVAEADKPKEPEQQASAPAPAAETPVPPVQKQEGEELN